MAELLRALWQDRRNPHTSARLNWALAQAYRVGWQMVTLGRTIGTSKQTVANRIRQAEPCGIDYEFLPPYRPVKQAAKSRDPYRTRTPDDRTIAELRELFALGKQSRGSTPLNSPIRTASLELSRRLAELVAQGFTVYGLAKAMGVRHGVVYHRLSRHGYRRLPPSLQGSRYKGVCLKADGK